MFLLQCTAQENEAARCYRSYRHLASVKRVASKGEEAHSNVFRVDESYLISPKYLK